MLTQLEVRHFAVVDRAGIEFGPGMTVVTGETGAGKSLLVDALLLLTGTRADASVVRSGKERAELAASFSIDARPEVAAWLRAQAFDEGDQCQIRRVIAAAGGSRAWINGRPATLGQLAELGALLVEIHGQHEHQALLSRANQLALLDGAAGHGELVATVARTAEDWRALGARIERLGAGSGNEERIDWLEHQLRELDAEALAPDLLLALEEEHRRLANAGQLLQGCAGLGDLLDGESEFALTRLAHRAQHEALRLAGVDPRLGAVAQLLEQAAIEISEAADGVSRYQSELDLDPARLAEADEKLARLHELGRKHRVPVSELTEQALNLRTELDALRGAGDEIELLTKARHKLAQDHAQSAAALGRSRHAAAQKLGAEVDVLLGELGMAGGRFEIALSATDTSDPDPQGAERVEFMVSANPGQALRPLRKVASGGELARISLAIEVAALGQDAVGTMVFDEVDAGIGGAVAEVVGQKLRRLGRARQVLCVTHLAQVAAQGHAHLKVEKSSAAGATETAIVALDAKTRRDEIARMLGGVEITAATEAHAKQMLAHAQRDASD